MLKRYNDLVNSPSKDSTYYYDEPSMGTSIETSMDSDFQSDSDFYSTFMSNYRKKLKSLMSSASSDDNSSKTVTEANSNLEDSINFDSNSTSFLYSKPINNQSYQTIKKKSKNNHVANLNKTISPTSHKIKTKINFKNDKIENRHYSNRYAPEDENFHISESKHNHVQHHSERKRRRRKLKDFLTFDPVFNKYFYSRDKIDSSDDEYEYYEYYDEYNDQENDESIIQNKPDSNDDIVDSNSIVLNETDYDYDEELMWVETGKISSKKSKNRRAKASILQPSLSTPPIKNLGKGSKSKKLQK